MTCPYLFPVFLPSVGILYHVQLFLSKVTSKIYKSSGTSSPANPAPPKMAKCSSFIAQAEWAALGGGISPTGLILTHVFSSILKIYVSFFIS